MAAFAAGTMVVTDILSIVMMMAATRNQGWLAGWLDTAKWLVSITTTTISVTVFQGHSFIEKGLVIAAVSAANLFGTKLGQTIGSRYVHDNKVEMRLAALENSSHNHNDEGK